MYEYIAGLLVEISPSEAVVEACGVGYKLQISLGTFSVLQSLQGQEVKVFTFHQVREDDETLYGFASKDERAVFTALLSVNGVGPGSARMILSAMSTEEVKTAILGDDVNRFKSVKGIGLKTAQRIILELKDKIGKVGGDGSLLDGILSSSVPGVREEAQSALVLLGFAKPAVEKVITSILKENPSASLEELIKKALKSL